MSVWQTVLTRVRAVELALDWAVLGGVLIVTKLTGLNTYGFRREFGLADTSLQHPYVRF